MSVWKWDTALTALSEASAISRKSLETRLEDQRRGIWIDSWTRGITSPLHLKEHVPKRYNHGTTRMIMSSLNKIWQKEEIWIQKCAFVTCMSFERIRTYTTVVSINFLNHPKVQEFSRAFQIYQRRIISFALNNFVDRNLDRGHNMGSFMPGVPWNRAI